MELTKQEKMVIRQLIKEKLDLFEKEEATIRDQTPSFLEGEVKYDEFLKQLLRKFE